MKLEELEKTSKILSMISEDIPKDLKDLEGKPFNGKNVAVQFGYLSAQVDAIAKQVKKLVDAQIEELS